jgi:putative hydrolase of the HAD superfamily
MIKAIAFDLGGVLFTEGKSVAYEKMKEDLGYDIEKIKYILTSSMSVDLRKGLIIDEDFWSWANRQLPEGYDTELIKKYWYDGYLLDDDVYRLAQKLKGKYKLLIFSGNIKSRIEYLENRYHFRNLFDIKVYSYDYHYNKPQKEFLEVMIKQAGVKPEEIVYIDDSSHDIRFAQELGINAIIYEKEKIQKLKKKLSTLGVSF